MEEKEKKEYIEPVELKFLKIEIENRAGIRKKNTTETTRRKKDCLIIRKYINARLDEIKVVYDSDRNPIRGGESIGLKTVERVWGFETDNHVQGETTYSKLAQAAGYENWDDFCIKLEKSMSHENIFDPASIDIEELMTGDEIILGWYPERYIKAKYKGEYEFEILESSSNLNDGKKDTFKAKWFELIYPSCIGETTDRNGNKKIIFGYEKYPRIRFRNDDKPDDRYHYQDLI